MMACAGHYFEKEILGRITDTLNNFPKESSLWIETQKDVLKDGHSVFVRKIILKSNYDLIHSLLMTEWILN